MKIPRRNKIENITIDQDLGHKIRELAYPLMVTYDPGRTVVVFHGVNRMLGKLKSGSQSDDNF